MTLTACCDATTSWYAPDHKSTRSEASIPAYGGGSEDRLFRNRGWAASHRVAAAGSDDRPADENHGDTAHGKKPIVPRRRPEPLDDVVDLQNVMVKDALDQVEAAEAQEKRADECPR